MLWVRYLCLVPQWRQDVRTLRDCAGDATFPFETAPAGLIGSNGQSGTVGGGSTGTAVRGLSPYSYGADGFGFEGGVKRGGGKGGGSALEPDFSSDRRSKGVDARSSRSAVERDMLSHRDMFSQSSLERLEEENGSLRAITRYLIHERKELRRKADTAVKRNQNLNNLLQVMRWTLTCGGAAACGVGSSSQLPGNGASGPSSVGQSPTFGSSLPGGDLLVCCVASVPPVLPSLSLTSSQCRVRSRLVSQDPFLCPCLCGGWTT